MNNHDDNSQNTEKPSINLLLTNLSILIKFDNRLKSDLNHIKVT